MDHILNFNPLSVDTELQTRNYYYNRANYYASISVTRLDNKPNN